MAAHPDAALDKMVMYLTSHTHSFGKKAALILGLRERAIDVDDELGSGWGLGADKLEQCIREDREAGLHPFIVGTYRCTPSPLSTLCLTSNNAVATVGTTNSGAIDRIEEIGALGKCDFVDTAGG